MAYTNVKLTYSEITACGLKKGKYEWMSNGSRPLIIDKTTKQIIEVPKMGISNEVTKSTSENMLKQGVNQGVFIDGKTIKGSLVVVGIVLTIYGGYKLVVYLKKKKAKKQIESMNNEIFVSMTPSLNKYLNNICNTSAQMTITDIKSVIDEFNRYSNGNLKIEISPEEMLIIRNIIVKFTRKLIEKNPLLNLNTNLLELEAPSLKNEDLLKEINDSLKVQELIFSS